MKKVTIILLSIVLFGCSTTRYTTTMVSCTYNKKKNQTEYMVFPYGYVNITGNWERKKYNQVSRQQFFENSDGIIISIALGQCNKFEFNADGSKKGYDFVQTFYNWEKDYFSKTYGLSAIEIEKDESNSCLIWQLFGNYNDTEWNTYFLSVEKNGIFKNFSVQTTDKWTSEQKIDFLKQLYFQ